MRHTHYCILDIKVVFHHAFSNKNVSHSFLHLVFCPFTRTAQSRPALSFLFPTSIARGSSTALPSVTRGLVGGADTAFAILPTPSPPIVSLLVLLAMLPALHALWRRPHPRILLAALTQSALAGFMFGWHVHEKAALVHCALLGLTAIESVRDARVFEAAALIAHATLLPLLFGAAERPIKVLLCAAHVLGVNVLLDASTAADLRRRRIDAPPPPPLVVRAYLWAGAPLAAALAEWVLPLALPQLPFLPLILLSIYGAVGNLYVCTLAWQQMQRLVQQLP
jgi:alpha-1,3-glucosyltransferase